MITITTKIRREDADTLKELMKRLDMTVYEYFRLEIARTLNEYGLQISNGLARNIYRSLPDIEVYKRIILPPLRKKPSSSFTEK